MAIEVAPLEMHALAGQVNEQAGIVHRVYRDVLGAAEVRRTETTDRTSRSLVVECRAVTAG